MSYETIEGGAVPIKAWTYGVPVEEQAKEQLRQTASLSIVGPHLAVMPDVHWGMGSTVGSIVPTSGAIIPACVGVDIGCGMTAIRTSLTSHALGGSGRPLFEAIEKVVPHGRTDSGGANDRGAWSEPPGHVAASWKDMQPEFIQIAARVPRLDEKRASRQLGTLGTGNHFVEVCLDESDHIWLVLHSGSRGVGNQIAQHFIAIAKKRADAEGIQLPNTDLAWLPEGTPEFEAYVEALLWAQGYARNNRNDMLWSAFLALRKALPPFETTERIDCHHNYVQREEHFGRNLWITRKGAVSARAGELGIIPGSMGTRSFIVRGKGNADSFHSCSHGAGRVMSRGAARKAITLEQHEADTAGVVCRKDPDVIDESPRAYKDIDAVMIAQSDLVEIEHTLKQCICVKG